MTEHDSVAVKDLGETPLPESAAGQPVTTVQMPPTQQILSLVVLLISVCRNIMCSVRFGGVVVS